MNPEDGSFRYPDFTIDDATTGRRVYWEHLGMLTDAGYRARWQRKLEWYRRMDILPHEQRHEAGRVLVWTRDDEEGGIDSSQLEKMVDEVFRG